MNASERQDKTRALVHPRSPVLGADRAAPVSLGFEPAASSPAHADECAKRMLEVSKHFV